MAGARLQPHPPPCWFLRASIPALACALALCLPAGPALAGQDAAKAPPSAPAQPDKPLWRALTPAQQLALAPLSGEWDKMEGARRQKWLEIANRFSSMKPDEQQRVHERMRDWVRLTPAERRVVRENYSRTKKLDPGKKSAQWQQYQQLPEEQKKKLAADAARRKQVANLPKPQSKVKAGTPAAGSAAGSPAAPAVPPAAAPSTAPASTPPTPFTNAK